MLELSQFSSGYTGGQLTVINNIIDFIAVIVEIGHCVGRFLSYN